MKLPDQLPSKAFVPDVDYPYWKTVAWRFVRGAIWGGIGNLATVTITLRPDFANAQVYFGAVLTAFITGAGTAGALVIRDVLSEGDKSAPVQKLPL